MTTTMDPGPGGPLSCDCSQVETLFGGIVLEPHDEVLQGDPRQFFTSEISNLKFHPTCPRYNLAKNRATEARDFW